MHLQMHRAVVAVVAVAEEVVAVAEGVAEVVVAAPKDKLAVASRHNNTVSLVAEVGSRMVRMGATGRSMGNPGDLRGDRVQEGRGVVLRQAKRAGAWEGAEGPQSKILNVIRRLQCGMRTAM
jgi:hypothetical protein